MPYQVRFSLLLALLLTVHVTSTATPHPGDLDAYGCHHDRQKGNYHCHQGQFTGKSFASQAEMQAARQEDYTAFPPKLPGSQLSGTVVSVLDGHTIEVLYNRRAKRIRLNGIDAPEKGQAFGQKAKQFVSGQAFWKEVTVRTFGLDKYGRTIGDVFLPDGRMLNEELVREGLAWWYRKYAPDNVKLEKLEAEAREAKRNLWSHKKPVPPWVYRHR
jgi:endonuclease YncB( thermonuclease family)